MEISNMLALVVSLSLLDLVCSKVLKSQNLKSKRDIAIMPSFLSYY